LEEIMYKARFRNPRMSGGLAAVVMLSLSGCGATGEVAGTVRLKGKPLSTGRITFTSQANPAVVAFTWIGADGSYRVSDCPVGPVKITVQTVFSRPGRNWQPAASSANGRPPAPIIPARYTNPATTDLEFSVTRGSQSHDVELKS
jgi:hypothetical protein